MFFYASYVMVGNILALRKLYQSHFSKKMNNQLDEEFYLPVSIIVPAYNESQTILTTIDNLLLAELKLFEIIVVDDGSTDNTEQQVIDTYHLTRDWTSYRKEIASKPIKEVYTGMQGERVITLVRKENGGNKADAVNAGINISRFPYFVSMDADEVLQADAILNAARVFLEDKKVVAVGGMIRASNEIVFENAYPVETKISKNPVVSVQRLEYNRAFMASRVFSDLFNGNLNISGGFGLFKKAPVMAIGGYDSNSVGEDMDLVMRLHHYYQKNGQEYAIRYAPDAICWTQVPFTFKDLGKQRARWHRGLIQAMWKHREFFFNIKFGSVSMISFMYYFFYEFLAPLVELLGFLTIVFAVFTQTINWPFAIALAAVYTVFSILQTLIFYMSNYLIGSYKFYKGDMLRALLISITELLMIRPYLFLIRIYATMTYRTRLHSWNKIERE